MPPRMIRLFIYGLDILISLEEVRTFEKTVGAHHTFRVLLLQPYSSSPPSLPFADLWLRFLMLKNRNAPAMNMPRMVMVERML